MPIEFFDLPQGTPSSTPVDGTTGTTIVGYCGASDVASLNKPRAVAWNTPQNVTTSDVNGYIIMIAGQIDAVLVNKGYSVPVNTASFPEVEGLLAYVNAQGAAYMVEEASPHVEPGSADRVKAAFDAAMAMLESASFTLNVPVDVQRSEPRGPFITYTPPGRTFDPTAGGGQFSGDGISRGGGCHGNPADPFFTRGMRF